MPIGPKNPPYRCRTVRVRNLSGRANTIETRTVWLIVAAVVVIGLSVGIVCFGDLKGDRQFKKCKAHLREHSKGIR